MKTLAIETSCDDTSLAIVSVDSEGNFLVEEMVSYVQVKEHAAYGGVVPEVASRVHSEQILAVAERIGLHRIVEVDCISVTAEPGLPGSLLVGKSVAATMAAHFDKPLVKVHHIMGHVFSTLVERSLGDMTFPQVCLTVSGGHNDLYLVEDEQGMRSPVNHYGADEKLGWVKRGHMAVGESVVVGNYRVTKLGQTRDDAGGEAYDKVSRMLGGPNPGGYWMDMLAKEGGPNDAIRFRGARLEEGSLDFSFSGLKSQVYNFIDKVKAGKIDGLSVGADGVLSQELKADIAWAFQQCVMVSLVDKLLAAGRQYGAKQLTLVGGVSASKALVAHAQEQCGSDFGFLIPTKRSYSTDNAAMIGVVGLLMSL